VSGLSYLVGPNRQALILHSSLVKKDFPPEFTQFVKDSGIRHLAIDMQGTKKVDIPESIMHSIVEVVLDKENYPLLIHCNHGKVIFTPSMQPFPSSFFPSTELAVLLPSFAM